MTSRCAFGFIGMYARATFRLALCLAIALVQATVFLQQLQWNFSVEILRFGNEWKPN
jgi:hypothetical protein